MTSIIYYYLHPSNNIIILTIMHAVMMLQAGAYGYNIQCYGVLYNNIIIMSASDCVHKIFIAIIF